MLNCKDASRLMSEREERALSLRERFGLALHLAICFGCRRFDRQLSLLRRALRKLGLHYQAKLESADLSPQARERIRNALAEAEKHQHDSC
ncbi:MAG: zf-HC2 domain-containing protein [Betaproteobacteria bacterium]|nr:zf-HC2 domain-containing protein [Betaproteobacteria bacterium]